MRGFTVYTVLAMEQQLETSADFRAEVARQQIPVYQLAAVVGLHPATLGQILRGHVPLTPHVADNLRDALRGGEKRLLLARVRESL
jgi:hypothetical protein